MPSPATTPDDIKATPERFDRTSEARPQQPPTTPHQAAEPSSIRRAKGPWPRVNKWLHYAAVNRERGMSTHLVAANGVSRLVRVLISRGAQSDGGCMIRMASCPVS
ncbi:hypothetical protein GCM10020001_049880 [Nonomuraea salmonea]